MGLVRRIFSELFSARDSESAAAMASWLAKKQTALDSLFPNSFDFWLTFTLPHLEKIPYPV